MFKQSVWIIHQALSIPSVTGGGLHRHYFMAKEFEKLGYQTTLFTGSFHHTHQSCMLEKNYHIFQDGNTTVSMIKTPTYKKAKSIRRIWNWIVFMLRLFFIPIQKIPRPDIIIVSSLSLLPILNGLYFKWRFGCKIILEIRDIWPLTLVEVGGYNRRHPLVFILSWIEKIGYKHYDYLSSNLPFAYKHFQHILGHRPFKFKWISNGIEVKPYTGIESVIEGFNEHLKGTHFNVGYAGKLGVSNAMEDFIEAVKILKNHPNIRFYVAGNGDLLNVFKDKVKNCDNIIFLGKIPREQVQFFLSKMDLAYIGWQNIPIYRYGISANKIFDYMLSGKPILMSGKIPGNEIEKSNCGWVIEAGGSHKIAECIEKISTLPKKELLVKGKNGQRKVIKKYTYEILAAKYVDIFNELLEPSIEKRSINPSLLVD